MPQEKEQRNKEFIKAWKEERLSNKALGEKFNLSPGGVKGLKARLRAKDPNLYTSQRPELTEIEKEVIGSSGGLIKFAGKQTSKPAIKQTSKQEKKLTAKKLYETVTYYITKEQKQKIKILAAQQDKEISQLVREILKDYFDKH